MQRFLPVFILICLVTFTGMAQDDFRIRGIAWIDENGDGIQDAAESLLAGIAVSLFDANNVQLATQITAIDGSYNFTVTNPGDYSVQFNASAGYSFSPQDAGNDTVDSDVAVDGRSTVLTFDPGNGAVDSSPTTFNPPTTDAYLTNPGMGWQQTDGRADPLLPETVAFANRADIPWRVLNPAENVYDWTALDTRLARAVAEGKQFSFRIYTMRGEGFGGHQMPDFVLANGATLIGEAPNYSNCVYQAEWARFVNALRQRYDGNPDIAYMDISGYANFNEWSWNDQTQPDDDYPNNLSLDGQARQRLADMFIGGAKTTHECDDNGVTQTVSYNYPGFSETQLIMPYAGIRQSTWYVAGKRNDVGIRYDCLGRPGDDHVIIERIGDTIEDTWRTAPIIYEFCPTTSNYAEALNLLQLTHGTLVHDNVNQRDPVATANVMRYVGYRYVVNSATLPAEAATNDSFDVSLNWQNIGTAPAYAQMGNEFQLQVYLVDDAGNVVRDVISGAVPNDWLPAADIQNGVPPNNIVTQNFTTTGLAPGTYGVEVAIVNTRTNERIHPGMQVHTDRRYPVGAINVVEPGNGNGVSNYIVDAGYVPDLPPTLTPTPTPTGTLSATPPGTSVPGNAGTNQTGQSAVAGAVDSSGENAVAIAANPDAEATRFAETARLLSSVTTLPAAGESPYWRPFAVLALFMLGAGASYIMARSLRRFAG